ncbi:MAG: aldehyde dehydrogenase family protein [Pseudomonadota bacterium]
MYRCTQFYIDGQWVDPAAPVSLDVINPADESVVGEVALGNGDDVDRAVAAARAAFPAWCESSVEDRLALLKRIVDAYKEHYTEVAEAITAEMGAPQQLASRSQAGSGIGHLKATIHALKHFRFEEQHGTTLIRKEPIGVCGLITPWNWPVNQIMCKVAPALATGCTMVLKPSEVAPLSAHVVARVLDAAGVPAGVFNLVHGDGPGVGSALSAHPDVDMMSFTGSTRAGVLVAKAAADTVKRVAQELGGKSANIILDDADLEAAVREGVEECFNNSGQSCNAPTRMLVPAARHDDAMRIAAEAAAGVVVGHPATEGVHIGPVVSETQYNKIQTLIQAGIDEGATLVAGGPGKPEGLETGYYVKPTVFANVTNTMKIAREEIFGPVLAILPYASEAEAIEIANDTPYGLSGYVSSGDLGHAQRVAAKLRTGMVHINGADNDINAPFGGYKQSGNGREWGAEGMDEFLETKAVMGVAAG